MDAEMTKAVAGELRKAVIEGFGKDLPDIDYGTPDYNKLVQLEKNVFQFSGAKNYQELKSMSLALKDANGKQREFKDFKVDAVKVDQSYNGTHLKTEFDTAVGGSQMAGKWVDFEQHADTAPWLRYDTAGDSKVRQSHKLLDGIIKLLSDAFWKLYYPPNGWKCRCDATQVLNGAETPNHQIQFPNDIPDMFKTNMAADGLVFPKGHPYFTDCPPEILRKAELLRENKYSKLPRTKSMKADVYISNKADEADIDINKPLAMQLASHGETVYIRPHDTAVKNPELQLGSLTGDFKTKIKTTVDRFVKNSIRSANNQACNIPVIVIPGNKYDRDLVWGGLRSDLKHTDRKKNVSHVWLLLDKQLVKISRADIMKDLKQLLP